MPRGSETQAPRGQGKAEHGRTTAADSGHFPAAVGYGNRTTSVCKGNLRVTSDDSPEDSGEPGRRLLGPGSKKKTRGKNDRRETETLPGQSVADRVSQALGEEWVTLHKNTGMVTTSASSPSQPSSWKGGCFRTHGLSLLILSPCQ